MLHAGSGAKDDIQDLKDTAAVLHESVEAQQEASKHA